MNEIIKLTIIDFCNMENTPEESIREEKYFKSDGKLSAHDVCVNYISTLTVERYLSWTGEVYPKFKLSRIHLEHEND